MQFPSSSTDFLKDAVCGRGPHDGPRVAVVILDVVQDRLDQCLHVSEHAALEALLIEVAEESFDDVEPRAAGGYEVHVEAGMPLEPALDSLVFVGGVVVDDEMKVELTRCLLVDHPEELDPLLMPMLLHAGRDDLALAEFNRSEQRRCSIPLVVMGHRAAAAPNQRQAGLRAIQSFGSRSSRLR